MFVTEHYEKWMDTPIFHCPADDRNAYLQLVHIKCFAATLMNSCVMNILVVKAIQLYLTSLLAVGALMTLLSPHLMAKTIPVIFIVFAFCIPYFRGNIHFRYGTFYIYCLICCMEVQGFEFLFDLYLIVCYAIETVYSLYMKKGFDVLATFICEFGMWTIPCSTEFRLVSTFGYLAIEAYNYPQIWGLNVFYVTVNTDLLVARLYEIDLEYQLELFKNAVEIVFEFFTNATFAIIPEERKFYKS
ncbi:hypothetical protein AVEN_66858-1 [Araneus ventricosus]|uniref:Uncharacterized protein n=1 Tax=Araneus ventricosus TaxID=182803 RepID=A0A4Y2NR14_ARAVE|nr:hypothetical protein AVEN_251154-1 [Araneus ventricosus]GBN41283.1 hypothetical protein AVEN_66858-1 [Araneus ventricosus]